MANARIRRAMLSLVACGMLAPAVACQGGRLSAAKFAERFIQAKVDKERLVAETCSAFAKDETAPSTEALRRDILRAKQHDLDVLARAVCGEKGCPIDKSNLTIQWPAASKSSAFLRVVLREIDKHSKTPEELEKSASRVLADGKAMAQILFKMNVARAGVFAALKLGDATQGFSDKLADSFGIAGGFARPVIEVVTSEIIAATMDQTFSFVENKLHVPRANFTEEACAIYKRSEPRANVAAFILERAILRYAPPEKLEALVARGLTLDCENLNQWIPASSPLDDTVCERIRLAVDTERTTEVSSAKPSDVAAKSPEEALRALVEPKAPAPDAGDVESFVAMEAEALRKSADACADAYPQERERACTMDRIVPVASDAYARAIGHQSSISADEMHFDDIEQRLAAIEGEIVRTKDRLTSDEQRMSHHEAEQKTLRELVEGQQRHLTQLEQQLLDQRRLVDTILEQDQSLRKMSGQMADLAVLAYRAKCTEQRDDALKARIQFAKNLGFDSNVCGSPDSLAPLAVNGIQIQPVTLCRPDLPLAIDFTFRFTHLPVGNEKRCDSEVRCDDPRDKELCDSMRRIADELSPADFTIPPEGAPRPYRFIGHASVLGVQACEKAGNDGANEMAQRGLVGFGGDRLQNGISYFRAKTASDEFGKLVQSKTASFDVGKHVSLVAAGTTHVTGIGNTAKPSEQEAFQREFQRISLEIHAPRLVFTVGDCVALH